jgi:hypothetical protein
MKAKKIRIYIPKKTKAIRIENLSSDPFILAIRGGIFDVVPPLYVHILDLIDWKRGIFLHGEKISYNPKEVKIEILK